MSMTAAMTGRINKALDKVYRFPDATESFRQRIERGVYSAAEAEDVPKAQYNRLKWNRMNAAEQADYERKMRETKVQYRLIYADDTDRFSEVPKLVHDWFIDRQARKSASTVSNHE